MVAADYVAAMASDKGAVRQDQRSMKAAWELGREVVQLIDKRFEFPGEFGGGLFQRVREKYGL